MKKEYIEPRTYEYSVSLRRSLLIPSSFVISDDTVEEGLVKEEMEEEDFSWGDIWDGA